MINGVLVERTVKDVVPALKTNSEGLKKILEDLVLQYKTKQDEMEKWKVGYLLNHTLIGMQWTNFIYRRRIRLPSFSSKDILRPIRNSLRD
jgi:prefoldin subunit